MSVMSVTQLMQNYKADSGLWVPHGLILVMGMVAMYSCLDSKRHHRSLEIAIARDSHLQVQ